MRWGLLLHDESRRSAGRNAIGRQGEFSNTRAQVQWCGRVAGGGWRSLASACGKFCDGVTRKSGKLKNPGAANYRNIQLPDGRHGRAFHIGADEFYDVVHRGSRLKDCCYAEFLQGLDILVGNDAADEHEDV